MDTTLCNMCMFQAPDGWVLVQHRLPKPGNTWAGLTFPGGYVESGESVTTAAISGVREDSRDCVKQNTKSKRTFNPSGKCDDFTSKKVCDRCGADLSSGRRTMSRFNEEVICMKCKEAEQARPDYEEACKAECEACLAGNYNFQGIGLK